MTDVPPIWENPGGGFPGQFSNYPQPDTTGEEVAIEMVDIYGRRLKYINGNVGGVDFKWSEPDAASFTVSPLDPTVKYLPLKTRNAEIRIRFPGEEQPFWGEPVAVQGGPSGLTFQCRGLLSIFGERFIDRASLEFSSVPQVEIMESLVRYAQSEHRQQFRNWNITPRGFDYSGNILAKLRSRQYWREEHGRILDLLNEFAHIDYAIALKMTYEASVQERFEGKQGKWKRYLDFIPVYEVIHPLSVPLVYGVADEPSNITSFTFAEDAGALTNDVYAGGGSAGDIRFEGHYTDQTSASVHGLRTTVISHGDMTDPVWLEDAARQETEERKSPVQTITVTVPNQANAVGRYAWLGTIWPLRIDYGRIQVDGNFRIVGRRLNTNNTFSLTLEQIMGTIQRPDQLLLSWPSQV